MPKVSKNPHDANFKALMSEPLFFQGFLKAYLPLELLERLDLNQIEIFKQDGKILEAKTNKEFESDLVYILKCKKLSLFLHIEHQTQSDRLMPLRVLHYQTAAILAYARAHRKKKFFPIIISMIYHQGRTLWRHSLDIKSLFQDPDLGLKYLGHPGPPH